MGICVKEACQRRGLLESDSHIGWTPWKRQRRRKCHDNFVSHHHSNVQTKQSAQSVWIVPWGRGRRHTAAGQGKLTWGCAGLFWCDLQRAATAAWWRRSVNDRKVRITVRLACPSCSTCRWSLHRIAARTVLTDKEESLVPDCCRMVYEVKQLQCSNMKKYKNDETELLILIFGVGKAIVR